MYTIAFMNLKGGTGKTVTTINTAAILARYHRKRVLLVDADSQANLTEFTLQGDDQRRRALRSAARIRRLPHTDEDRQRGHHHRRR